MNRVILLEDTASAARANAAAEWINDGDTVWIAAAKMPENPVSGAQYLVFDALSDEALAGAVQQVTEKSGRLDILVVGTALHPNDGEVGAGRDYDELLDTLDRNVGAAEQLIEGFLPLLSRGMKRIACITEPEAANSQSTGSADFGYYASAAAVNMIGKIYFNRLRPEGFTFRWFCESGVPGGFTAAQYITSALCYDANEPYIHSDENRLVLRDNFLRELSW